MRAWYFVAVALISWMAVDSVAMGACVPVRPGSSIQVCCPTGTNYNQGSKQCESPQTQTAQTPAK